MDGELDGTARVAVVAGVRRLARPHRHVDPPEAAGGRVVAERMGPVVDGEAQAAQRRDGRPVQRHPRDPRRPWRRLQPVGKQEGDIDVQQEVRVEAAGSPEPAGPLLGRLAGRRPALVVRDLQVDGHGDEPGVVGVVGVLDHAGVPVVLEPAGVGEVVHGGGQQQGHRREGAAEVEHVGQVGATGLQQRQVADERLGVLRGRPAELVADVPVGLPAEVPLAVVGDHHLDQPGRRPPDLRGVMAGDHPPVEVGLGQGHRFGPCPGKRRVVDAVGEDQGVAARARDMIGPEHPGQCVPGEAADGGHEPGRKGPKLGRETFQRFSGRLPGSPTPLRGSRTSHAQRM